MHHPGSVMERGYETVLSHHDNRPLGPEDAIGRKPHEVDSGLGGRRPPEQIVLARRLLPSTRQPANLSPKRLKKGLVLSGERD